MVSRQNDSSLHQDQFPTTMNQTFSAVVRTGPSHWQAQPRTQFQQNPTSTNNLTSTSRPNMTPQGRHDTRQQTADPNNNKGPAGVNQQQSPIYRPSRKCAVVLQDTRGISQDQCLRSVADLIGGHNIHYVTRLSGGARICLYLTDQTTVEKLCEGGGISVGAQFVPIRRYVSEAKKVVISNCPPELSDEELKILLQPYGTFASAPTRLKVTTSHDDLKHIRTWRRSVYMMLHEEGRGPQLPPLMNITSPDGFKYTIYIDKDELVCNFCLGPGHVEEKCKRKEQQNADFPLMSNFRPPAAHRLFVHSTGESSHAANKTPQTRPNLDSINNLMPQFSSPSRSRTSSFSSNIEHPSQEDPPIVTQETPEERRKDQSVPIQEEIDKTHQENTYWYDFSQPQSVTIHNEAEAQKKRKHSPEETLQSELKSLKPSQHDSSAEMELDTSQQSFDSSNEMEVETDSDSYEKVMSKSQQRRQKKEEIVRSNLIKTMNFDDSKLSAQEFEDFLDKCRGKANSKKVAAQITRDKNELLRQLERAFILCPDQNLSRRLDRAIQALKQPDEI